MTFNDNARLDTSRVGSGGGGRGRGPVAAGGGLVGLILFALVAFGVLDPSVLGGSDPQQGQQQEQASDADPFARCKTGADANNDDECRMVATENSLYNFWSTQPDLAKDLQDAGQEFRAPEQVVIYQDVAQSACGTASNQIGPFYCPTDEKIFLDVAFYEILSEQLGSSNGALAQEYVLAHEYGHHIQNIYGVLRKSQEDPQGPDSGAVRVELMADCMAGMWMANAAETKDADGNAFLKTFSEQDINDAMSAAKSVGDDSIQQRSGQQVNPEGWTHGSSAARQAWLQRGMQAESITDCDTFAVQDPENP